MIPLQQHSKANRVLGDGGYPNTVPLAIRDEVQDGVAFVVSYWQPSSAELATLNAGGSVALWIMGRTMPPAFVGSELPDE